MYGNGNLEEQKKDKKGKPNNDEGNKKCKIVDKGKEKEKKENTSGSRGTRTSWGELEGKLGYLMWKTREREIIRI
jgi:hypothetical protein